MNRFAPDWALWAICCPPTIQMVKWRDFTLKLIVVFKLRLLLFLLFVVIIPKEFLQIQRSFMISQENQPRGSPHMWGFDPMLSNRTQQGAQQQVLNPHLEFWWRVCGWNLNRMNWKSTPLHLRTKKTYKYLVPNIQHVPPFVWFCTDLHELVMMLWIKVSVQISLTKSQIVIASKRLKRLQLLHDLVALQVLQLLQLLPFLLFLLWKEQQTRSSFSAACRCVPNSSDLAVLLLTYRILP